MKYFDSKDYDKFLDIIKDALDVKANKTQSYKMERFPNRNMSVLVHPYITREMAKEIEGESKKKIDKEN